MKKASVLLSFLLVIILIMTSCKSFRSNAMPGENATAAKSLSDDGGSLKVNSLEDKNNMTTIPGVSTNYVKLDDINPDAVSEIRLRLNIDTYNYILKETMDGFLCGSMGRLTARPEISVVLKGIKTTPAIRKLDKTGNIVWEKEYDYETYSGKINNLLVYSDGSFIFSVQAYPYSKGNDFIFEKSFIIKCDKDGKELWKRDFDDYYGGLLQNLFIIGNDGIIAVGQWRSKNGKQTKEEANNDVVVTKLDKDGNILQQKGFGGSDFDSLNTSKYDRDLGIIINGRTQSSDGDFAIRKDRRYADFIACIDESLNLKWVSLASENENFIYDQIAVSEDFVYVLGAYASGGGTPTAGFLVKLDKRGKRVWTKSQLYAGLWGRTISILQNGDIVIGAGEQNQGVIVILDKNANEKKRLENLKFAPNIITSTDDGGYIVTAVREIKCVPQPLYISSIWYDTEFVAVKYKNDYTIEWGKTYDKYKDKRGLDFGLTLKNGKIIVEGVMN